MGRVAVLFPLAVRWYYSPGFEDQLCSFSEHNSKRHQIQYIENGQTTRSYWIAQGTVFTIRDMPYGKEDKKVMHEYTYV